MRPQQAIDVIPDYYRRDIRVANEYVQVTIKMTQEVAIIALLLKEVYQCSFENASP